MEASCGHPPRGIRSPQATGARAVKARLLQPRGAEGLRNRLRVSKPEPPFQRALEVHAVPSFEGEGTLRSEVSESAATLGSAAENRRRHATVRRPGLKALHETAEGQRKFPGRIPHLAVGGE